MDRLGVSLARAESVAGVVFEAKSVTRANQVESEWSINYSTLKPEPDSYSVTS